MIAKNKKSPKMGDFFLTSVPVIPNSALRTCEMCASQPVKLPESGFSSEVTPLPAKVNAGEGWSLQAAKWVTRTSGSETPRKSPFEGTRNLTNRSAEADEAEPISDAGEPSEANRELVFALVYAR
jgi:hypothetical protein